MWREALAAGETPILPGRRSRSVLRCKTTISTRFSHARQTVALLTSNKKGLQVFLKPFWIGGGENRTLVLSKLLISDYMLIALKGELILQKGATRWINFASVDLERPLKKRKEKLIPRLMTIVLTLLVGP